MLGLAVLSALAAGTAAAQPPTPDVTRPDVTPPDAIRRVMQPPPLQWDHAMLAFKPALRQTNTDLVALTGGFSFGMTPADVNARLPEPYAGLAWTALPAANEYPGEVRYFWVRLDNAGLLRTGIANCTGSKSYLAFLFSRSGLFRLSYRFIADETCPVAEAARDVFARFVTLGDSVLLSTHYRTGRIDVVDLTDPTAKALIPVRFRQTAQ